MVERLAGMHFVFTMGSEGGTGRVSVLGPGPFQEESGILPVEELELLIELRVMPL